MVFISISVSLLIILLTLHFLAKARAEFLSWHYKWVAYGVLVVAGGMLLFQLAKGGSKVWHRQTCKGTECNSWVHMNKHQKRSMQYRMNFSECCCSMMNCADQCVAGGKMDCCAEMGGKRKGRKGAPGTMRKSIVDTLDGKIIRKEVQIIKDME